MAAADIDRNLLFGLLALQDDLIDQNQFTDACALWALRVERPLAEVLLDRRLITEADRRAIDLKIELQDQETTATSAALARFAALPPPIPRDASSGPSIIPASATPCEACRGHSVLWSSKQWCRRARPRARATHSPGCTPREASGGYGSLAIASSSAV